MAGFKTSYGEHKGLDTFSNDLSRPPEFSSILTNKVHKLNGSLQKRPGQKPVSPDVGGCGLFIHKTRDVQDGSSTAELLTIGQGKLWRAVLIELTIEYTGSADSCLLDFFYNPDTSQYNLTTTEDGVTTLNLDLGVGTNEGSSFPVYSLQTLTDDINGGSFTALLNGSATLTAASGTSAAFLFPHQYRVELVGSVLTLSTYVWEEVNCPISTGLFNAIEARKDADPNFELISSTNWDALTYFANEDDGWESGIFKYDGQTYYLAGMPEPPAPFLAEVAATGTAEVTSITCNASTAVAEITQVQMNKSGVWKGSDNAKYFIIYDQAGSVGVYYKMSTKPDNPPSGYNRVIKVDYVENDSNATVATKTKNAMDADSQFSATVSTTFVTITDAANGPRTDADVPRGGSGSPTSNAAPVLITILRDGVSSNYPHGKYFLLSNATHRNAFWYDVDNTGTISAPSVPEADNFIKISTVTGGMTADQIATATEAVIEVNGFSSSVSGAVITVTDDVAGAREDGNAGSTGFIVETTTQGTNAGLGTGEYTYHLTYQQRDAQGIITEGLFSSDSAFTTSTDAKNIQLVVSTILANRGFNTGCAIVNGTQSAVNTITVDTGHTLEVGDQALIKVPAITAVAQVEHITCVADVAGSLDAKYFYLYSSLTGATQATAFWIDVDNNGTTEPSHGAPSSVEITTITTGMTNSQVATEIASAIDAQAGWAATALGAVVTVTNAKKGLITDSYDGNTTFTFAVVTPGHDAAPAGLETHIITAISSTSITVDGNTVSVTDNDPISNGLSIRVWRTEKNGPSFTKFLVTEFPNNSFVDSITFIDSAIDADLGETWVEPEFDHGLPPHCRYITTWAKSLVVAKAGEEQSIIAYSIPFEFSPEYFPPEANSFPLYSNYGDVIRGLYSLQDGVLVFKERSYFPLSGDIYTGNIRVDKKSQFDMKFASNASIVEAGGTVLYGDKRGIYNVNLDNLPSEASQNIRPEFNNVNKLVSFRRAVGFYDTANNLALFNYPAMRTNSDTGNVVTDVAISFTAVYNAFYQCWYRWENVDMSGGVVEYNEDILFQGWIEQDNGIRSHHLYRLSGLLEENNPYSYEDHTEPIVDTLGTAWYVEGSPSIYKSYSFIKPYVEGELTSITSPIIIETQRDLITTESHTRYEWDSTAFREHVIRLKPSKVRRLRVLFSNESHNSNAIITGWEINGKVSENTDHLEK